MSRYAKIMKILTFYGLWLANVIFANTALTLPLLALSALLLVFSLKENSQRWRLGQYLVLGGGLAFDSAVQIGEVLRFTDHTEPYLPFWMISLWLLFTWLTPDVLSFFQPQPRRLVLLSAISGPATYASGIRFGLIESPKPVFYLLSVLFWASLMSTALLTGSVEKEKSVCK